MRRGLWLVLLVAGGCDTLSGNYYAGPDAAVADLYGIDFAGSGDGGGPALAWSLRAPLPLPRQDSAAVELNGRLYLIGGYDRSQVVVATVDVYDPPSGTWRAGVPMPGPLLSPNAAVVNGKIYVCGGLADGSGLASGVVYGYDPQTKMWTERTSMPAGSERGAAMTAAIGGRVYVAGGFRGGAAVVDFSYYDPLADAWTAQPPLPAARDHGMGTQLDDVFYAIGGRNNLLANNTARVDSFDPRTAAWEPRTALPTARSAAAVGVLDGQIVVAGGEVTGSPLGVTNRTDRFDPTTSLWSTLPPLRTARHAAGATVGFSFVVAGGADRQGFGALSTVEALGL